MKVKHLVYIPFSGLGLYNGFRGNGWLKNRIQVFKQFVIPSLKNQSVKDFTVWCSWRYEEKFNPIVIRLMNDLDNIPELDFVHTFHGICFWDDKYPDEVARDRLLTSLHGSLAELTDVIGEADEVLMTIQPSDDLYHPKAFEWIRCLLDSSFQAAGFSNGYVMNYRTKEVAEWNPTTNPPFFTIKFPRAVFIDPLKHFDYTGPYKSHEYVPEKLKYAKLEERGFIVGTHGDNISTVFDHPFKGRRITESIQDDFQMRNIPPLTVEYTLRRRVFTRFPYRLKRKLRWYSEKKWILRPIVKLFYDWIRG